MSDNHIGILGTGLMGAPIARRLAAAGWKVSAWNRSAEKLTPLVAEGITPAATPAELAAHCEVLICLLSDADACEQAIFAPGAALSAARPGTALLMMSTLSPEIVSGQAERAAAAGVEFLDLPVSGGTRGAEQGTLSLMAGGDAALIEHLQPLLAVTGRVTRVGEVGAGQLTKLVNQIVVAGTLSLLSEALLLAERGGADPVQVREALLGGFADSTLLRQHGERMVSGDFAARGPAKWQLKDTRSAVALADELGLSLPLTTTVNQLFTQMIAAGDGELDHCAILRQIRRLNGERL